MNVPKGLMYTKSHEWLKTMENGNIQVGITDHAQKELTDIVFANLNDEGDDLAVGEVMGDVESIKAVSDIYSPVTGTIAKVNAEVLDAPELLNTNPYEAWMVEFSNVSDKEGLLSPEEYLAFLESLD